MSRNKTILLVDDQKDVRELLSEHLMEHNYYIINAPSAEVSIRLLQELQVDLIITDLAMPGINGVDFIKLIIHTLGEENRPKIMVYTGYKDILSTEPTLKHVDKVLDKLSSMKLVVEEIVKLLGS